MRSENKTSINSEKIIYFDKKYLKIVEFENFDQKWFFKIYWFFCSVDESSQEKLRLWHKLQGYFSGRNLNRNILKIFFQIFAKFETI